MKVRLKQGLIVVTGESPEEIEEIVSWAGQLDGHVFSMKHQDGQTFLLSDLGPRAEACREPINVTSRSPEPEIQLISNFAHTPFELDGQQYGSVEAFWQGLKFPRESERRAIAPLHGGQARRAGQDAPEGDTTTYGGKVIRIGTADHWELMKKACRAKFRQHEEAKQALLSTGVRPLTHKVRRDSKNIPGVIMADIWMKIREELTEAWLSG